jgi:uncharacterized membrane protein (UPF0127 family)
MRLPIVAALLALLLVACGARIADFGGTGGGQTAPAGPQVVFPAVTVRVELARTEAERARGLGGHAPLGEREGMLFIFERPGIYSFWMKGMTFPLDIMWIDDGRVVHLASDVPPPAPGTADSALPIYTPAAPARYVLEVNAGFARRFGITVGTPVELRGL